MTIPAWTALMIAIICAALMGYAVQRGATCAVAAVDEIVSQHKANRFAALAEASIWVAGLLILADHAGLLQMQPMSFAPNAWTIAGGALLGLGAVINRACVFGTIARLGSHEWAYSMTPIGFFFGCLTATPVFAAMAPEHDAAISPIFSNAHWLIWPFLAFATFRLWQTAEAVRDGSLALHIWSPHRATAVIGITFAILLLSVGAWSYTEALADLANGVTTNLVMRLVLLAALFSGALIGGWLSGLSGNRPSVPALFRCFMGGLLMGWGSTLIPGGNDGLILIGIPFFLLYAWLAFMVMCISIAVGIIAGRALAHRPA